MPLLTLSVSRTLLSKSPSCKELLPTRILRGLFVCAISPLATSNRRPSAREPERKTRASSAPRSFRAHSVRLSVHTLSGRVLHNQWARIRRPNQVSSFRSDSLARLASARGRAGPSHIFWYTAASSVPSSRRLLKSFMVLLLLWWFVGQGPNVVHAR